MQSRASQTARGRPGKAHLLHGDIIIPELAYVQGVTAERTDVMDFILVRFWSFLIYCLFDCSLDTLYSIYTWFLSIACVYFKTNCRIVDKNCCTRHAVREQ